MAYLVVLGALKFFRSHALTWPALATSHVDMPYHLALIGELKHHMPPMGSMVAGEPLFYHWFVYAHFAAASWVTGVEPLVLLLRLAMLPMLAALVVLLAMTARRITGSPAGALLAVAGTFLMTAPNLYLGVNIGMFTWRSVQSWTSPSQTFGALLFAPVVLLLCRPSRKSAVSYRQVAPAGNLPRGRHGSQGLLSASAWRRTGGGSGR